MKENNYEEKILALLYSNEYANDLLAVGLIQNLEDKQAFEIPLLCLFSFYSDKDLKYQIQKILPQKRYYIASFLTNYADDFFQLIFEQPHLFIQQKQLSKPFTKNEILDLAYFCFRRTNDERWLLGFFELDEGNHPKRKWMFESLIGYHTNQERLGKINLLGLFYDEIDQLGKAILNNNSQNFWGSSLSIVGIKANTLPPIFLERNYGYVLISGGKNQGLSSIPEYVYSFKDLVSLTLHINQQFNFPVKSNFPYKLRMLELQFDEEVQFLNFDFLNLFPDLNHFTIDEKYSLENSDTLLKHENILIEVNVLNNRKIINH